MIAQTMRVCSGGHRPLLQSLIICLLSVSVVLSSQQRLRVDVRLVNVSATLTDSNGRYIGNLTKDDFILEEDGVPQEITHFSQDQNIPVSVGIVFDTSGSMENKMRTATSALDRFVRTIHEDDDIFLLTFASRIDLRQDFTNNRDKLAKAFHNITATGATVLYDAVGEALIKIKSGRHQKRAILLVTDGEDNRSTTSLADLVQQLHESEVLTYALGIAPMTYAEPSEHVPFNWPPRRGGLRLPTSSRRDTVDMNVLQTMAHESGGRAYVVSDSLVGAGGNIDKILGQIAQELRSQYTLGFYPKHPDDSRFHTLTVRTRSGLVARARPGYVAR